MPELWKLADLGARRKLLLISLDAFSVDTVQEKAIVAWKPEPAFQALFQIATTRVGSGGVLYKKSSGPGNWSGG